MSHVPYSFPNYKQGKLRVYLKMWCFCTFRWDNYETPPLSFYQNTHSLLHSMSLAAIQLLSPAFKVASFQSRVKSFL